MSKKFTFNKRSKHFFGGINAKSIHLFKGKYTKVSNKVYKSLKKERKMFIISETHCQQCKILKQMLGDKAMTTEFRLASENLDLCKELDIKTIPALVKDDKTVIFDLDDIVTEIEKDEK